MPYKISGVKSETARVIIFKESDWSIESNTVVSGSGAYEVDGLVTGTKTTLARTEDGELIGFGSVTPIASSVPKSLWSVGINDDGQLGLGDTTYRSTLTQVGTDEDWSSSAVDNEHTAATKTDGTIWTWGNNDYGQLGLGDIVDRSSPVQVGTDEDWSSSATGNRHTAATKTDGTLWGWGNNLYGQLGQGHISPDKYSSPVQVGLLDDWNSISAGGSHSLALKTDGTIWSWGRNYIGQLGLGNTTSYSTPQQVGADVDWSSVSAGHAHSAAIKTDGTLWTWGSNTGGLLGLGDIVGRSSPVQVGTDEDWSKITDGVDHTLAVKTDGTLWGWGWNDYGQLGLGHISPDMYSSPVQVGLLEDWSSVSAGSYHSVAVKTDGTLWAWGWNDGELGLGDTVHRSSPVQVGSATWTSAAAGNQFMCVLK